MKKKILNPSPTKREAPKEPEDNVIPYKSSLPPLKTPKGLNHSFNMDLIRGGGKYPIVP
jgi:hypothetical protein